MQTSPLIKRTLMAASVAALAMPAVVLADMAPRSLEAASYNQEAQQGGGDRTDTGTSYGTERMDRSGAGSSQDMRGTQGTDSQGMGSPSGTGTYGTGTGDDTDTQRRDSQGMDSQGTDSQGMGSPSGTGTYGTGTGDGIDTNRPYETDRNMGTQPDTTDDMRDTRDNRGTLPGAGSTVE